MVTETLHTFDLSTLRKDILLEKAINIKLFVKGQKIIAYP